MTSRVSAASTRCLAIGPAVSCLADSGTTPDRLTRPSVGLMPTAPFWPEGQTIEPSVSVPIATVARLAATPAPEPEDEPHGLRSSTYGLLVWPPTPDQPLVELVERKLAHSDRFALPMITAPALRSLAVRNASAGGVLVSSANEPAVVGSLSWVPTLSFSRIGMPSSGERAPCLRRCWSLARAIFSAS